MQSNDLTGRRAFLKNSAKAAIAASITIPAIQACATGHKVSNQFYSDEISWTQQPLGYAYNALEPAIDAQTMEIHHTKHAAAYSKNLSDAVKEENVNTASTRITQLLENISGYSQKMRNNAGGHYNHELFWKSIQPPSGANNVSGKLADLITNDFGSFDAFKAKFSDAAKNRFGSGWAWLVFTPEKKLVVSSTPNQDNPLMNIADVKGFPVLGLDVWEHAYYLRYQNKRTDYINAWWGIINWDYIQKRFSSL